MENLNLSILPVYRAVWLRDDGGAQELMVDTQIDFLRDSMQKWAQNTGRRYLISRARKVVDVDSGKFSIVHFDGKFHVGIAAQPKSIRGRFESYSDAIKFSEEQIYFLLNPEQKTRQLLIEIGAALGLNLDEIGLEWHPEALRNSYRFAEITAALKSQGHAKPCRRCNKSGSHSYYPGYGDQCFDCSGRGYKLPAIDEKLLGKLQGKSK